MYGIISALEKFALGTKIYIQHFLGTFLQMLTQAKHCAVEQSNDDGGSGGGGRGERAGAWKFYEALREREHFKNSQLGVKCSAM